MKMVLNRDFTHASTAGRSIKFVKGIPSHVPPRIVPEIIALGGEIVGADEQEKQEVLGTIQAADTVLHDRAPTIEAAVRRMLERNQRGDFTAGGRPNLNVLFKETGLQVETKELEPIWAKIREELVPAG